MCKPHGSGHSGFPMPKATHNHAHTDPYPWDILWAIDTHLPSQGPLFSDPLRFTNIWFCYT